MKGSFRSNLAFCWQGIVSSKQQETNETKLNHSISPPGSNVTHSARTNELPYFRNATDLQVLVKHNGEKGIPAEIPQIIKDLLLGNISQQVRHCDI